MSYWNLWVFCGIVLNLFCVYVLKRIKIRSSSFWFRYADRIFTRLWNREPFYFLFKQSPQSQRKYKALWLTWRVISLHVGCSCFLSVVLTAGIRDPQVSILGRQFNAYMTPSGLSLHSQLAQNWAPVETSSFCTHCSKHALNCALCMCFCLSKFKTLLRL
jgi:hypothetical protein